MTFIIKNQLNGTTVQSHAEYLRLAKLDWEIHQDTKNKDLSKPAYAVPPDTESDSDSNSESEAPLPKIIKQYRRKRYNGRSDEEHIPLAQLSRRIKQQQILENQMQMIQIWNIQTILLKILLKVPLEVLMICQSTM